MYNLIVKILLGHNKIGQKGVQYLCESNFNLTTLYLCIDILLIKASNKLNIRSV